VWHLHHQRRGDADELGVEQLSTGRNTDELMRKSKANIYITRKPIKACAAKWKDEGDATLTPSAKMVG
jgi:peroxiredoxin (alkyl hydroperoxide reductase subunit C)